MVIRWEDLKHKRPLAEREAIREKTKAEPERESPCEDSVVEVGLAEVGDIDSIGTPRN